MSTALLLTGDPGCGRTALIRHAAARANREFLLAPILDRLRAAGPILTE
ncbi:MAG: ATP-binding protein [Anaerolineae bacterium]|nr:ATP-binding protein [Anaerolineae bacterium]